jgi:hypothetical protein
MAAAYLRSLFLNPATSKKSVSGNDALEIGEFKIEGYPVE